MKTNTKLALLLTLAMPVVAAADGAATFKTKCASCHGADGAGQTTMGKKMGLRALGSADVQKQSDAELTRITTDGKNKMPAYKGKLTDPQIKELVAFMRSLKK